MNFDYEIQKVLDENYPLVNVSGFIKASEKSKKQIRYYNKASSDYYRLDSIWLEDKAICIEGGDSQCY